MKRLLRAAALCLAVSFVSLPARAFAQKETIDLMTFEPPKGWTKEVKALTYTVYTTVDQKKGTYCRLFLMLSTPSKGSVEKDFDHEWKELVVREHAVTQAPQVTGQRTEAGWQIKSGKAPFTFKGVAATATLTTMTGHGKTTSVLALANSESYAPAIRKFLASIELKDPAAANTQTAAAAPPPAAAAGKGSVLGTTNFSDGWTSTAQDDWVLVTKQSTPTTRVLIHYPNKSADAYNSVLLDGLKNAWNVLVAPKYGPMKNLAFKPIIGWQSIEFAEADAVEKATGKPVHVVLFQMNYSNGSGRYLEFITPDKATFEKEFGAWHEASYGWEKMERMANYNKFIVSAADLQGKWTSDFSGALQYVNAYTGFDAGMNTHASAENFHLGPESAYRWDLGVASGMVGNIQFQSVKSAGKFSVSSDGWKVTFSDIEGKPRTYEASFSHIKGLRVLWLDNRPFAKAQ